MVRTRTVQRIGDVILIALITLACLILPTPASSCQAWQEGVDAFAELNHSQELPIHLMQENPAKTGEEFDVCEYFDVLDHLSMEPGLVLDYVYYDGGIGREPILYVRQQDQAPYMTYAEYVDAGETPFSFDESRYAYLNHVQIDDTEEGFFQFVMLRIMGGQFYLFWHALYNDHIVVANHEGLEEILSDLGNFGVSDEQEDAARALDLAPVVEMDDETVTVKVVVFTKWGGFSRGTYVINREFPHTILDSDIEVLVEYDWGILF